MISTSKRSIEATTTLSSSTSRTTSAITLRASATKPVISSESRYQQLMDEIIKAGVRTKVLLLSATPVNNDLKDLRNQLYFLTEGSDEAFADTLGIGSLKETLGAPCGRDISFVPRLPTGRFLSRLPWHKGVLHGHMPNNPLENNRHPQLRTPRPATYWSAFFNVSHFELLDQLTRLAPPATTFSLGAPPAPPPPPPPAPPHYVYIAHLGFPERKAPFSRHPDTPPPRLLSSWRDEMPYPGAPSGKCRSIQGASIAPTGRVTRASKKPI